MKLYFLMSAYGRRLAKHFTISPDGELVPELFTLPKVVTSIEEEIQGIEGYHKTLRSHGTQGHAALTGIPTRPIVAESRVGLVPTNTPTEALILDGDGLGVTTQEELDALLDRIGLGGISYVRQASSSQGIKPGMRGHLWFLIDGTAFPSQIKSWLIKVNLEIPELRERITLHSGGQTLRYTLDPTVNDSARIIFIAPPTFADPSLDPIPNPQDRFELIRKHRDRVDPSLFTLSPEDLKHQARAIKTRVDELRTAVGQPPSKPRIRGEVIYNPDPTTVVAHKDDGEFIRVNLPDSDSWGYFINKANPKVLHNFKGIPPMYLPVLDPDFYEQIRAEIAAEPQTPEDPVKTLSATPEKEELTVFAFTNRLDQRYYAVKMSPTIGIEIHSVASVRQVDDWYVEHGLAPPEFIPTWTYAARLNDDRLIDFQEKFINKYIPSIYLSTELPDTLPTIPADIERLIRHAVAYNETAYERLVHDLAWITQRRTRLETAWVLQGTFGTGKGVLFEHVLRPVFGPAQVRSVPLEAFNERFTPYDSQHLLLWIDEADAKNITKRGGAKLESTLRNAITERTISIEKKGRDAYDGENNATLFFASNEDVPTYIRPGDRRYKIAPRQETPLLKAIPEWATIAFREHFEPMLQQFADYLRMRPVDDQLAHTVFESQARDNLAAASMSAIDTAIHAIKTGSVGTFLDELPLNLSKHGYTLQPHIYEACAALKRIFEAEGDPADVKLPRSELEALVHLVDARAPDGGRFSRMLARHNLHIQQLWIDGKNWRGFRTFWHLSLNDRQLWASFVDTNHGALGWALTAEGTVRAAPPGQTLN